MSRVPIIGDYNRSHPLNKFLYKSLPSAQRRYRKTENNFKNIKLNYY